jgi:hypothetical protein
MGAQEFTHQAKGKTAREAFANAVRQAQHDYGHAGYTGTIAEKNSFVLIPVPDGEEPVGFANDLLAYDDERVSDKWGPAGCVEVAPGEFYFFGWASS